jgi:hypothetical protein
LEVARYSCEGPENGDWLADTEVGRIACNFIESYEPSGPITDCEEQLAGEHHWEFCLQPNSKRLESKTPFPTRSGWETSTLSTGVWSQIKKPRAKST